MPHDHLDALLTEAAAAPPGAYLTLAAVSDDRRETQLDRRPVGDHRTLRDWLARAVAEHRATHPKLRLRLWGPGGRPIRGSMIPPTATPIPIRTGPETGARPPEEDPNRVPPRRPCPGCATAAATLHEARRRIAELERHLQEARVRNEALRGRVRRLRAERDALAATAREGLRLAALVNASLPAEDGS